MNNNSIFYKRSQELDVDKFDNTYSEFEILEEDSNENETQNPFQIAAEKNSKKQEDKFGYLETTRDVVEQAATKGISGLVGAYGNILDAFNLQLKEGEQLPGQIATQSQQYDILTKINNGETPSIGELMMLADDDIILPPYRLPTSKDVKSGIEEKTGIGEGKTPAGRIAGKGAEFVGEGVATGGGPKTLATLAAAGTAGQSIREAGGPEVLATGVEIGLPIAQTITSGKLSPTTKSAKDTVEAGRKIGLTEKQITPLIQPESKSALLSKVARKGGKTKKLFTSIKDSLGDSYNTIKSSPQAKVKLPNADQIKLRKEFVNIRNELSKTLAPSPEKEAAINYIEKALKTLQDDSISPEYLVNFWQDINKTVKWNSINGGKKALARLKEPVSQILKKNVPELAENFELTNQLYTKYANIAKKLKPDLVESFVSKGEAISVVPSAISLAMGNPLPLAGLGGEVATRILAREMLINPYFQNLSTKLVTNINQGSFKSATDLVKNAKEYLSRKYPDEDWSFLTDIELED